MYLEFTILSIKENVILFLLGHPTPVSFKITDEVILEWQL